jgi:hypothetical protein
MFKLQLFTRGYAYNEQRNLKTYDRAIELRNVNEEITELEDAMKENNIHEIIDALCDISVFAIGRNFKKRKGVSILHRQLRDRHYLTEYDRDLNKYDDTFDTFLYKIKEDKMYDDVLHHTYNLIDFLGYDPNKCLEETFKHIESRKGEINHKTGKFEKFKTEEYTKLWYEPDYDSCQYENVEERKENND